MMRYEHPLIIYRYFVDLGFLLDLGQPPCVISDLIESDVISHLKMSKGTVFPVSTKYRYSGGQKP
jgi:hypothetical protein